VATYSIELRKDISSVVATISKEFSIQNDLPVFSRTVYDLFNQSNSPLYYIAVLSQLPLTFDELVMSTNALVRGEYPFAAHPNFIAMLLVTSDDLLSMAAQGMRSDSFGNVQVEIFARLDDAVSFIRSQ
jgi:hypothetical protein